MNANRFLAAEMHAQEIMRLGFKARAPHERLREKINLT